MNAKIGICTTIFWVDRFQPNLISLGLNICKFHNLSCLSSFMNSILLASRNLADNEIDGTIPTEIGNLQYLTVLFVFPSPFSFLLSLLDPSFHLRFPLTAALCTITSWKAQFPSKWTHYFTWPNCWFLPLPPSHASDLEIWLLFVCLFVWSIGWPLVLWVIIGSTALSRCNRACLSWLTCMFPKHPFKYTWQ